MKPKKTIIAGQEGMVLVLAIFMLSLLSMIGMAAMMTSTTEIDISANEKFHKIAFYQAEAGLTIGTEIIEFLGGYDEVADNTFMDGNNTIRVIDGDFLFEAKDVPQGTGIWDKDNQTDYVRYRDGTSLPDIQLLAPFAASIDVDKVAVRQMAGGGAEFGAGAEGIGVTSYRVIYNIDCIGNLPGRAPIAANTLWGFQFVPRF